MKALALDFEKGRARSRRAVLALAVAAIGFAAYTAAIYAELKARPAPKAVSASARPENPEELAFARETLSRMSVPWDALFSALERSRTDGVALLSVEPNGEARTLRLTGEAKTYLAALTYVAALGQQDALQKVHLLRHEARGSGVSFAISASWKDAP